MSVIEAISTNAEGVFELPASFAQQRLWLLHQLETSGSAAYHLPTVWRLHGRLSVAALERSLNAIVQRHEALRTTFDARDGELVQIIAPELHLPLPVLDLADRPGPERDSEAMQEARAELQRPFDLERGPLLRAKLIRLSDAEHILIWVVHHIVSDGWSQDVLRREIAALYTASLEGGPSPLPDLSIQYADFAIWQRDRLQGEMLDGQLAYWKQQLGGRLPALELAISRPRPAVHTTRGGHQPFNLSTELADALKTLSRREGATLFMTLLAAFKTLLHRYSGQTDVLVGTPIANRNRVELEPVVGCFANTIVLRTDLSGDPTFREVLSQVRNVSLQSYAHQDVPFEQLVEALNPDRDLSRTPLFQVMFVLQNSPGSLPNWPGLELTRLDIRTDSAMFDLTLGFFEDGQGLAGVFEYNVDLFGDSSIERMIGHFQMLLAGLAANPDLPISRLPLMTDAERRQVLVEWNDTRFDYPHAACLHHLFEEQVARTPDAVAVTDGQRQWTYCELNRRANQLAHHLRSMAVGPGTHVGLCVERSLETLVGVLGILKSGGAYVPLDPAYPAERLGFVLTDAQVPIIVTQERLRPKLPAREAKLVHLDADAAMISDRSEKNLWSVGDASDTAYVIYTSGSMGQPKGVPVSHRSLVNHSLAIGQCYGLQPDDRLLQFASIGFDVAAEEIFPTWLAGATVVLNPDATTTSLSEFRQFLIREQLTFLNLPTPFWEEWVADLVASGAKVPPTLRVMVVGSDRVLPSSWQTWRRLAGDRVRTFNAYGLTETTITSLVYRPGNDEDEQDLRLVPIGRPIANTQVYLLDAAQQPVPVGLPGELYVGGDGVARGYLNRSDATAERFVDWVDGGSTVRLYRTGDLARYRPDGNLELIGRVDDQVKLRGFRVEPGEIEAVLGRHPAVREAVVVLRENSSNSTDKYLVAYVVTESAASKDWSRELRDWLKAYVPDYMIPAVFVALETMPMTPSGKIDRRGLPEPRETGARGANTFVAPHDLIELQLAQLWQEVLGVQDVGVQDNFFDLGGYSLLAVRLLAKIEQLFNRKLPLASLFQFPTVEQLARALRENGHMPAATATSLVAIRSNGSKRPFFAVPGDLGNVFTDLGSLAHHLGSDRPFYGLQDGVHNPSRIESLAKRYVDEVRSVQPRGPYLLGGVCMGGVVAFEMARQLHAQGESVALLAMIEPSPPPAPGILSYVRLALSTGRQIFQRLAHHVRNVAQLNSTEQHVYLRLKLKLLANGLALARYRPHLYHGPITLFLAEDTIGRFSRDPRLEWDQLTDQDTTLHLVPGSHDTLTGNNTEVDEGHMRALAEKVSECLAQVDQE